MPKSWDISTSIALEESRVGVSQYGIQRKPKRVLPSGKSSSRVSRLPLANLPNMRTSNHKLDTGKRIAVLPKAEKQVSNDKSGSKSPDESQGLESKIRSALSRGASPRTAGSPSTVKSLKAVKFDPSVVFCSGPHTPPRISTHKDNTFHAGVEAILKCKKDERQDLLLLLNKLTKIDIEDKKPAGNFSKYNTLNPRAPAFKAPSSLKAALSSRTLGPEKEIYTPQSAPKRKFHPRTVLTQDIFERQSSESERPFQRPRTANQQFQSTFQHREKLNNSTRIQQPLVTLPSEPRSKKTPRTHQNRSISPGMKQDDPIVSQDLSVDPFDDSGAGRVALAIEPFWAQAILGSFMEKYPLTGLSSPTMPLMLHGQRTAEVQQQLEFILWQKREIEALTVGP